MNNHKYRCGNDRQTSLGSINIRIPIPNNKVIKLQVDVINSNEPFLIGLDSLDMFLQNFYRMFVNKVSNQLWAPFLDLQIPRKRKCGYVYLE